MIYDSSQNRVLGLTTAASIWAAASLGLACGAGESIMALMAAALVLLMLTLGRKLERVVAFFQDEDAHGGAVVPLRDDDGIPLPPMAQDAADGEEE